LKLLIKKSQGGGRVETPHGVSRESKQIMRGKGTTWEQVFSGTQINELGKKIRIGRENKQGGREVHHQTREDSTNKGTAVRDLNCSNWTGRWVQQRGKEEKKRWGVKTCGATRKIMKEKFLPGCPERTGKAV